MFRKSSLILLAALFCIPFLAHAEESTVLDFSSSREQQEWNMRKLTHVSAASEGVRIQTTTQGTLLRPIALPHSTDVIEILYTSPRGGSFSLLWQRPGGGDAYSQLPFTLAPAAEPRPLIIMPSMTGNWTAHPGAIGFSFPEGTDITLRTMTLRGWSPTEKLAENVKCFWTFDTIAPHSINYFWGPLLCSTPVARKALYEHAPPIAHSGMRFIYTLLGLGLAVLGWHAWRRGLPRKHVLLHALLLVCLLWAALDIRMGAELLRNWTVDVRLYVRESAGARVFRSLLFFPDFAEAVRPIVNDQP
ncbi:MAG: hypothetical protein PHS73_03975, partial [Candidatus Peribacteraceae bacterium]|nr:hypothetical protein [Candidatus Peribacteraceae bacterium]